MARPTDAQILFRLGSRGWPNPRRWTRVHWSGFAAQNIGMGAHTRADASPCATYADPSGTLRIAAANKLRATYVDLDGDGVRETRGWLLEGSRQNIYDRSEEADHGNWGKNGATVTANNDAAPDGTTTSDRLIESALNENHFFSRLPTLSDNTLYAWSVFAKYTGTRAWFRLKSTNKANLQSNTWFNVQTGAVGTTQNGQNGFIEGPFAGGHYRCGITFDAGSGATPPITDAILATADAGGAYLGDGASGMGFWGMQLEPGGFSSSYIKTVAAAVTRAADSWLIPLPLSGEDNLTVLSVVARPVWAGFTGSIGAFPGPFQIGFNTSPRIYQYFNSSARQALSLIRTAVDTSQDSQSPAVSIPAGATISLCSQYRDLQTDPETALDTGSGYGAFSSGAAVAFTKFGTQQLAIGSADNPLWGVLIALVVARGLFSKAEMEALL